MVVRLVRGGEEMIERYDLPYEYIQHIFKELELKKISDLSEGKTDK